MLEIYVHIETFVGIFIAVLFIIPEWKQPKCSSTEEWINEVWYVYTIECYSAIKRNRVLIHVIT